MITSCVLLVAIAVGANGQAYLPVAKEHFLTDSLLREVVDRMGRDLAESYLDSNQLTVGEDPPYYQDSPHPSLRDREYLQHSSLWGHQYMTGGAGEGKQHLKPDGAVQNQKQVKTDAALPAYCNPPNPCPIGYNAEDGCLEEFENTAAFSREYQSAQDCMCDSEHMFDCSSHDSELDQFVQQFQAENPHKNLVAKKYHVEKDSNPFLRGDKLPVAVKKGLNVVY
ncbi:neuroendocrine protein 7B2 isoform X2 [Homalodisca vitripennis]|uniref:neuroendocrine protein 7B2 isoform X2 n=1 Tax=Homalodisca vitripennis TaxID=197043 RepID=UPI001EE9E8CF|nr:neuroendocrine protein 7B2 isoform X2 [Homalodisca vitripennis]